MKKNSNGAAPIQRRLQNEENIPKKSTVTHINYCTIFLFIAHCGVVEIKRKKELLLTAKDIRNLLWFALLVLKFFHLQIYIVKSHKLKDKRKNI